MSTHAIILCGGSGSRLWPRSRSRHPKHLLDLSGGVTLVQETVRRLGLPPSRVYCVTEASHHRLLRKQLPQIPARNIVVEPARKGTAGAIALALAALPAKLSKNEVVLTLPADHLIEDQTEFRKTITAWRRAAAAEPKIVTLGISPTYPSTGFGYIHLGPKLRETGKYGVHAIKQFVEKPDERTARRYLANGKYLWNAGMFAATLETFTGEFDRHLPEHGAFIRNRPSGTTARSAYLKLPEETIDYGIIEKSRNLAVVPASFAWADVGSWADLHDVLEHDANGNVFEGEYVDIDTKDCFVHSPKQLVATIGVQNLVIINTKDAVLICPKDRAQDVKKIVQKLKQTGRQDFL